MLIMSSIDRNIITHIINSTVYILFLEKKRITFIIEKAMNLT
jgi:hypothetical protein